MSAVSEDPPTATAQATTKRRRDGTSVIPWRSALLSIAAFLPAFLLLRLTGPAPSTDLVLAWEGQAWGRQAASLLVPLSAIPLAFAPLQAASPDDARSRAWLSVGLLAVYAISLPLSSTGGLGTGLATYLALVGLLPLGVLVVDRSTTREAAPAWAGGARVLVAGALTYGVAVAGVVAVPPLAVGLLGLLVGTPLAVTDERLAVSAGLRRACTAYVLAFLALALLVTGAVAWCLASPLVYLAAPPAVLGLVVLLWPTSTGSPAEEPDRRIGRVRGLAASAILGVCLVLLGRGLGWLGAGLCL